LVLEFHEFDEVPFVCKMDGPEVAAGAVYIRPAAGRPRTERIQSAEDMRDLLSVAAERQARRIVEQARRLGLLEGGVPQIVDLEALQYDSELGEL
jgi:hypothetical protein